MGGGGRRERRGERREEGREGEGGREGGRERRDKEKRGRVRACSRYQRRDVDFFAFKVFGEAEFILLIVWDTVVT